MKISNCLAMRAWTVLAALLMTTAVSGCMTTDSARLVAKTSRTADYIVTINFDDYRCPKDITPPAQVGCTVGPQGFCAKPGGSVQWISKPEGTPFVVYFDPFVGRPYESKGADEKTTPVVVRRDSLPGEYKYSVLGVACSVDDAAILDPPLRVEF